MSRKINKKLFVFLLATCIAGQCTWGEVLAQAAGKSSDTPAIDGIPVNDGTPAIDVTKSENPNQDRPSPGGLKPPVYAIADIKLVSDQESSLRRAEVIFLLSLPFTAIVSLFFLNTVYYISDPGYKFSMTALPPEIVPFAIFSTFFTSGVITYADYRTVQDKKNRQVESANAGNDRELQIVLGLKRSF